MYRNGLLVIHIVAVAAWLGCNLTQLALTPVFVQRGGESAVAWFEATSSLAQRYYNLAGAALGVSGVLLVLHTGYDWSDGFVGVGIGVLVLGGILGTRFFAPASERLAAAQRSGGTTDVRRYLTMVGVDSTLLVVAVVAMVARWRA